MGKNKGLTVGQMETQFVWVVTQETPYVLSEYIYLNMREDWSIIMEVVETMSLGILTQDNIPKGVTLEELEILGLKLNQMTHFAKVKVLDNLSIPILPHSTVYEATFEQINGFLNSTDIDRSFVLGVIKGTECLQHLLPNHLQNILSIMEHRKLKPQNGIPFLFDFHKFTDMPNVGVFGGAGSGKSTAVRSFAEECMRHRLPGVFLDPHDEFSFDVASKGLSDIEKQKFKKAHEVLVVGEDVGIEFETLNTNELLRLFSFFEPSPIMEAALRTLHDKGDSYEYLKNKMLTMKKGFEEERKPKQDRDEFALTVEQQIMFLRYRDKVSGFETLQALLWRFEQLGATNIFKKNTLKIEQGILNRKLLVIRGDTFRTELLASFIIRKLYYKRVDYENNRQEAPFFPGFMIFTDEAHRYAPQTHRTHPTRDLLVEIAREGRKFGVFLIVATQRAASLDMTLTAQLNTKFIFRTTNSQDMDVFRAEANLTEQDLRLLPNLTSGHCFASSAMFSKNFSVQFKAPLTVAPKSEDPFDQLPPLCEETEDMRLIKMYIHQLPSQTLKTTDQTNLLVELTRSYDTNYSIEKLLEVLTQMVELGDLSVTPTMFGETYKLMTSLD